MRDVDASSIVYGWDNYPIDQFPALWRWIAEQIAEGRLAISRVAFEEVKNVSPDCADWLHENDIPRREITNEVIAAALDIKNLLGIANDAYNPKGVGENDVLIIATAKVAGAELISDENRQTTLPPTRSKYKMPAVCALPDVAVSSINFVEFIKQSARRFG